MCNYYYYALIRCLVIHVIIITQISGTVIALQINLSIET